MRIYGEGIRWMLMFLVMLHHFAKYTNYLVWIGALAVNCFLILSGIVNAMSTSKTPSIKNGISILAFIGDVIFRRWFPLCTYSVLMIVSFFCTGQVRRPQPLSFNFLSGNWQWLTLGDERPTVLFIVSPTCWFITALFFYQLITPFLSVFFFSMIGDGVKAIARIARRGRSDGVYESNLVLLGIFSVLTAGLYYYCRYRSWVGYFKPYTMWANIHTYLAGYALGGVLACTERLMEMRKARKAQLIGVWNDEDPALRVLLSEKQSELGSCDIDRYVPYRLIFRVAFEISTLGTFAFWLAVMMADAMLWDPAGWFMVFLRDRTITCSIAFSALMLHLLNPNSLVCRILDQRIIRRFKGVNGQTFLLIYMIHDHIGYTFFSFGMVSFNEYFYMYAILTFIAGVAADAYVTPAVVKAQHAVCQTLFKPFIVRG